MTIKPNMITERILRNGYPTLNDAEGLVGLGVTDLVNLDRDYPNEKALVEMGLDLHQHFVPDVTPIERELAVTIISTMRSVLSDPARTVYVHCEAGRNRSPTVIWLYLLSIGHSKESASEMVRSPNNLLIVPNGLLVSELDLSIFEYWQDHDSDP